MAQQGSTWGDPTMAGLFAVAAGNTAVWAILTERIAITDASIFIAWLLAAGLILTIVGLIGLRNGDTINGVLNLCFGVFFFATPALTYIFQFWGGMPLLERGIPGIPTTIVNGYVFIILGIVLATFVPILGRTSWTPSIAMLIMVIGIFLMAFYLMQGFPPMGIWPLIGKIAGWFLLIGGLTMLYIGMALGLLTGFGRMILPLGRPIFK
jgi:hypothetical protein